MKTIEELAEKLKREPEGDFDRETNTFNSGITSVVKAIRKKHIKEIAECESLTDCIRCEKEIKCNKKCKCGGWGICQKCFYLIEEEHSPPISEEEIKNG